jgi:endopeptidase Clp ATP-binding regulatory subunit ClpX
MSDKKPPSPEEIQKEFEDFVRRRFGGQVHVITQGVPLKQDADDDEHAEAEIEVLEEKETFDLDFNLKPKEVKAYLDRFIIRQDEAKKALGIAVCDHYNQVREAHTNPEAAKAEYAKQNVLILGPTGVGKTYMIRQIAKLIGVPFVKADATRFSETGYMGANVDDLIRDLVHQAAGNIELAQFGIVYLDEADKLASPSQSYGRDVSGRGVQLGMLKLMEETEVDLRAGNDPASQMQAMMDFQRKGKVEKQIVNTRHILFIVSGAFTNLKQIVAKRLNANAIGFIAGLQEHQQDSRRLLHHATTEDFIEFGYEPEFVGRLPVRVACDELSANDLLDILRNSEGSIIRQYEAAFAAYGITVLFADDALEAIAELAHREKTGARSLMTVCERILRNFKFELPSTTISEFVVTRAVVENPDAELARLLEEPDYNRHEVIRKRVRAFEKSFAAEHGMIITFDRDAEDHIYQCVRNLDCSVNDFLRETLTSYEHGLKLVQKNTGQDIFSLGADVVKDPQLGLERLITASYASRQGQAPGEGEGLPN